MGCSQSKRLLECAEDTLLVQVLDKSIRGEALLHLVLTSTREITEEVKTGNILICNSHTLTEFLIARITGLKKSGVRILTFKTAKFRLFKNMLNKTSWEEDFRGKGVKQSCLLFKNAFLRAKELYIPESKK